MANTSIKLKKSGVSGNVPIDLEFGETALNYADGKLYYKNANNVITYISTGAGGGSTDSFSTINVNSTLILATSNADILSFASSSGISLSANPTTKVITIDDGITKDLAQAAFDYANTIVVSSGATISDNNTSNNVMYINFTSNTSGPLSVIETSSANLSFTPATGTLNVNGLTVTPNTSINSKTMTVNSETVIDSLPTSVYRSAFYQIQMERNSLNFHILNLNVLQIGGSANTITFGEIYDDFSLGTFSATVSGGNLNVIFTPADTNINLTFIRNAMTVSGVSIPSGNFGFLTEPVTDILNLGYVADTATITYDYGNLS